MHFRKIVALVVREFVAHHLKKRPSLVTVEEFTTYIATIQNRTHFLNTVFGILFGCLPRSREVRQYVECWFCRPNTLIGVRYMFSHLPRVACDTDIYNYFTTNVQAIFNCIVKPTRDKPFRFTTVDFVHYSVNTTKWCYLQHHSSFKPHEESVAALLEVLG